MGRATFTALTAGQGKFTFQSTPSVGRATQLLGYQYHCLVFQSTPSVGRATTYNVALTLNCIISIHALRGEGDNYVQIAVDAEIISIHALRGEGDKLYAYIFSTKRRVFQSTPSVGRATRFTSFCKVA